MLVNDTKSKKWDILSFLIVIYLLLSYLKFLDPTLRYAKYLFPIIPMLLYHTSQTNFTSSYVKVKVFTYIRRLLKLYLTIYFISFLLHILHWEENSRFWANFYFVISPIVSVLYLSFFIDTNRIANYFTIIFYGSITGFLLEQGNALISEHNFVSIEKVLLLSEAATESNIYPFVFSFLFLFALYSKYPTYYKVLSIVFIVLGSKRIVFIGLIGLIILYFAIKNLDDYYFFKKRAQISFLILVMSFCAIYLYFGFAMGNFDELIESYFTLSANQLSMGRQALYSFVINKVDENNIYWGTGIGSVDMLIEKELGTLVNLHSELLRNFIELGLLLYSIWVYIKCKILISNKFSLLSLLFLFCTILTDNILIYFECMFVLYFLIMLSLAKKYSLDLGLIFLTLEKESLIKSRGVSNKHSSII